MRPRTQKQPQVKKELCRVLDNVDVDVYIIQRYSKQVLVQRNACTAKYFQIHLRNQNK